MLSVLRRASLIAVFSTGIYSSTALSCHSDAFVLESVKTGTIANLKLLHTTEFDFETICDTADGNISLLHVAAKAGQVEVIKFLLELGYSLGDKNNDFKKTPLNLALQANQKEAAKWLVEDRRTASLHKQTDPLEKNEATIARARSAWF